MSSERQRSDDESPSTSSGSSDADQRDPPVQNQKNKRSENNPRLPQQQKKSTKLSSKTTAKLSSSAKRIQKELAEITLDPPPNCSMTQGKNGSSDSLKDIQMLPPRSENVLQTVSQSSQGTRLSHETEQKRSGMVGQSLPSGDWNCRHYSHCVSSQRGGMV
ncbi:ubiquitin-conjugating enzyme E2 E3-like [Puntigrus tetrazona]|uniref:ubiquitin-conjugating enzyme E2 E3-like n=1 Tax=Puntigrus tetrazona TaxID=1606681 RepID=UPI001C89A902|nr:ubiquitin-conjugating enzyme E2 E3-like [Puntigrus tetrazona]